jgi:hypothetical protein
MSIGPKRSFVPATRASTSGRRAMLHGITCASPPCARMPAATGSQASRLRLDTTTFAPSAAMVWAIERRCRGSNR